MELNTLAEVQAALCNPIVFKPLLPTSPPISTVPLYLAYTSVYCRLHDALSLPESSVIRGNTHHYLAYLYRLPLQQEALGLVNQAWELGTGHPNTHPPQ